MSARNKIALIFFCLLLSAVAVLSGVKIYSELREQQKENEGFAAVAEIAELPVTEVPAESVTDTETVEKEISVTTRNIPALIAENADCIGWLSIDGTNIRYPVMHTPNDPQKYLRRSFYGQYSQSGVPFLDGRCNLNSDNLIIYGHNMKNGTMFADLKKYLNTDFLNAHRTVRLETADGVKGLMDTNRRLKDCMLFNILSFMSNELLGKGSTAASVDELYLFLSNMTTIEYLHNCMKRVRKKDSSVILASQNIEDFLIPSIREFTKPLFSIPTHQFLFNASQINPKEYMDALQVEPSEFELIKYPERGTCLYRCGNERYLLQVIASEYKAALFGKSGGR